MTAGEQIPQGGGEAIQLRPRSLAQRAIGGVVRFLLTAALVVAGLWAIAALALADLDGGRPRRVLPILFTLAFLGVLTLLRPHRRARWVSLAMVLAVMLWYFSIAPSNDRPWAPQYSRLATATIEGDRVTLHNYRVVEPGANAAPEQQYVDRTFDLTKLLRADLIMSYWGPTEIGHALASYEFSDGNYVGMSIEVRRRASQKSFDMVTSLFRNFELVYVLGDEKALIGPGILDDHHRVFLYRTDMTPQRARALFLRYASTLNELAARPQWYNAITDNCTTGIYMHLREIPPAPPFSFTILLNGYLPEHAYQMGHLETSLPFEELNRLCNIKDIGRTAYESPEFSRIIRQRIPVPESDTSLQTMP